MAAAASTTVAAAAVALSLHTKGFIGVFEGDPFEDMALILRETPFEGFDGKEKWRVEERGSNWGLRLRVEGEGDPNPRVKADSINAFYV